jgi:hypothetical protein
MTTTLYRFAGKSYRTLEAVELAVMEAHPELNSDKLPDFVDSHVEEVESVKFDKSYHKSGETCELPK